jgi:hypothetical protein
LSDNIPVEKQMNNKVLCLIPTVFLAAACGQQQIAAGPAGDDGQATPALTNDIEFPGCEIIDIDACPNPNSGNPPIMIQVINTPGVKKIEVLPNKICANQGDVLHFDIIGPPAGPGSVTIFPKKFVDSWLIGTNSPTASEIEITVPSFVLDTSDHDYLVVTSTGLCVDPRIHVR